MTIREMCKAAQEGSIAKGFHTPGEMPDIDQKLMLTVGELVEAQNELRNGHFPTEVYYTSEGTIPSVLNEAVRSAGQGKPEGFLIELADAVIRIGQLAEAVVAESGGHREFDLQDAIELKMAYNDTRPHKHGGKAF